MAHAVEVTIGTGNKVSLNYQSEEVNLSITYALERGDTDVLALVREKAQEVVKAHQMAWDEVREGRPQAPESGHSPSKPPRRVRSAKGRLNGSGTGSPNGKPVLEIVTSVESLVPEVPVPHEGATNGVKSSLSAKVPYDPDDPFGDEMVDETPPPGAKTEKATAAQIQAIETLCRNAQISPQSLQDELQSKFNCAHVEELSRQQAAETILALTQPGRERLKEQKERKKR